MVEGTAGEVFVEQLKQCGVRFVFFNPSTGDYPIFDALLNRPDMQVIMALQEGVLTAMADGYEAMNRIAGMKPEEKVSLNIVRNRQPLTVDVVIGTRPPAETE